MEEISPVQSYANILPDLVGEVRSSSKVATFGRFRQVRSEHYNAYSVPIRMAEILDVLYKYTGMDSLVGLHCLDAACGFGGIPLYLVTDCAAERVTASDIDIESLCALRSVMKKRGLNAIEVTQASLERLPLADETVDISLLYDCLVYRAIDIPTALADHLRVLRPGGTLIVKVANAWSPMTLPFSVPLVRRAARPLLARLAASADRLLLSDAMELRSAWRMRRLLASVGFIDVRLYDRYRRAHKGAYRYFVPDVIYAATKPGAPTELPVGPPGKPYHLSAIR